MTNTPVIHPDQVFTLDALQKTLNLRDGTLAREIRLGRLRSSKRAGRRWILGAWVLEWLQAGESRRAPRELVNGVAK
jgi:hypothetical protein